jgi:hypothetical protein
MEGSPTAPVRSRERMRQEPHHGRLRRRKFEERLDEVSKVREMKASKVWKAVSLPKSTFAGIQHPKTVRKLD